MLNCCNSLKSIDLFKFNTSNVINMSKMLYSCELLKSIDLSKFKIRE